MSVSYRLPREGGKVESEPGLGIQDHSSSPRFLAGCVTFEKQLLCVFSFSIAMIERVISLPRTRVRFGAISHMQRPLVEWPFIKDSRACQQGAGPGSGVALGWAQNPVPLVSNHKALGISPDLTSASPSVKQG